MEKKNTSEPKREQAKKKKNESRNCKPTIFKEGLKAVYLGRIFITVVSK